MARTPSTRARSASEPSSAAHQSRNTPEHTSSTRRFFPARARQGARSESGEAASGRAEKLFGASSASALSGALSFLGAGFQKRTCVTPKVTSRSGSRRTGEKSTPRTAGGVVWYDRADQSMRPTRGPPELLSSTSWPPVSQAHSETVCPSSPATVATRSPRASNATPMMARAPRGWRSTASAGSPERASRDHTIAAGSRPISPLAATRARSCTARHRTSSAWPRKCRWGGFRVTSFRVTESSSRASSTRSVCTTPTPAAKNTHSSRDLLSSRAARASISAPRLGGFAGTRAGTHAMGTHAARSTSPGPQPCT